jgi:glycosyltransferase involved in cell wall biosynthesis
MDGLEWKRSKYGFLTKLFLKKAENWAVKYSDVLISDSKGIQNHLEKDYKKSSVFIPYGASISEENDSSALLKYKLQTDSYYLVIARLEPENNIETIIKGYLMAKTINPLIIIGSTKNKFGSYLTNKYSTNSIRFLGPVYNIHELNQLRFNSEIYFHGHSVGGTNPSLLEAMASSAYICAHYNEFNFYVLENDALYFNNEQDISKIITQTINKNHRVNSIKNNISKIKNTYTWEGIANSYNKVFTELCRI